MKRRSFLSLLAIGSASTALLDAPASRAAAAQVTPRVLVLLELRGGNDGLNMLAPHQDPLYRQARPTLALRDGLPLTDDLALHPSLAPLLPLWEQRRLGFALGVGWPQANRSHFKAADQWATAHVSGEGIGWLAAAYGSQPQAGPLVALSPGGSAALEGGSRSALLLSATQLQQQPEAPLDPARGGSSPILRRLLALEQAGAEESARLRQHLAPLPDGLAIPNSTLGHQVALALRLIGGGACPPVLQLSQDGYDTHANQANRHAGSLRDLASALAAFDAGLRRLSDRPRVTLLTVSEFGRRLHENGSGGTDHGSASVALLYGDTPPPRLLGRYPRLDALDSRGDLVPSLSPVALYRHVLQGSVAAGWRPS